MAVAEIAEKDAGIENRINCAVDDDLTGKKVQMAISAAVADALTNFTEVDALVDALKDHEGYKQRLTACMGPVADRIGAEYTANLQSASIYAPRSESVARELVLRTPPTDLRNQWPLDRSSAPLHAPIAR